MRHSGLVSIGLGVVLAGSPLRAQTPVVLPDRDNILRDRPVAVYAIGSEEGETWELLSNVISAAFDSKDNLYVLDGGNQRVLVFDASGRFVRQIGKQGGGPGEFQFPSRVAVLSDDRLVVLEGRGHSVFRPDGTFENFYAAGGGLGRFAGSRLYGHPAGGIVVQSRTLPEPGRALPEGGTMAAPIVHVGLDDAAEPRTILPLTEPAPVMREATGPGGQPLRMMVMGTPREVFRSAPSWAMLGDGSVAFHEGGEYRIRIGRGGAETQVLTRAIAARAPGDRDRERAREERRASLGSGPSVTVRGGGVATFSGTGGARMPEEEIRRMLDNMTFADRIDPVHDLFADPTGRLWVERAPTVWGDPPPLDLITMAGRYIGTVPGLELPLAVSRTGLAAWVEKDDMEVEQVVVRRLPASWN
jgi:hypothetical protein